MTQLNEVEEYKLDQVYDKISDTLDHYQNPGDVVLPAMQLAMDNDNLTAIDILDGYVSENEKHTYEVLRAYQEAAEQLELGVKDEVVQRWID